MTPEEREAFEGLMRSGIGRSWEPQGPPPPTSAERREARAFGRYVADLRRQMMVAGEAGAASAADECGERESR